MAYYYFISLHLVQPSPPPQKQDVFKGLEVTIGVLHGPFRKKLPWSFFSGHFISIVVIFLGLYAVVVQIQMKITTRLFRHTHLNRQTLPNY